MRIKNKRLKKKLTCLCNACAIFLDVSSEFLLCHNHYRLKTCLYSWVGHPVHEISECLRQLNGNQHQGQCQIASCQLDIVVALLLFVTHDTFFPVECRNTTRYLLLFLHDIIFLFIHNTFMAGLFLIDIDLGFQILQTIN